MTKQHVILSTLLTISLIVNSCLYYDNYIDVRLANKKEYNYIFDGVEYSPTGPNMKQYLRNSFIILFKDSEENYKISTSNRNHCSNNSVIELSKKQNVNLEEYINKPIIINKSHIEDEGIVIEEIELDNFILKNFDVFRKVCPMPMKGLL